VAELAKAVQEVTGQSMEVAFVDQGYTGEQAAADAAQADLKLEVIKHYEAKRGFVLLPRRWVVERSFAWAHVFGGWLVITNDRPKPWQAITGWPL
jgi:transposase